MLKKVFSQIVNKWYYFLFAIITLFIYKEAIHFDFVNFDDHLQVIENIRIQGLSFQHLKVLFTTETVGMYQPLTSLVLAIIFHFAELNAGYYHLFSVLVHLLNGFLFFTIILKLFTDKKIAIVISLLFLVHPIMVESILWVSATSTILYVFFYLLATLAYIEFQQTKKKLLYIATFLIFILGLLCKIQTITFVAILFLIDWVCLKKTTSFKLFIQKIPFIAIAIVFVFIAYSFRNTANSYLETNYPIWVLAPNQIVWYLFKFIAPFSLTILYDWPTTFGIRESLFSFIFTGLIFSFIKFRYNKLFVFGSLFFMITLGVHTAFFIQFLAPYADRYGYLAFVGFLILTTAIFYKKHKKYLINTSLALILVFAFLTSRQTEVWRNSNTLWTHNLKSQKNLIANVNKASYLVEELKDYDLALHNIKTIIQSKNTKFNSKHKSSAYYFLGIIYLNRKKLNLAERSYIKSIAYNSKRHEAHYNLGNLYSVKKEYKKAIKMYTEGLKIAPKFLSFYKNRANAYYQTGKYSEALKDVEKAITLDKNKSSLRNLNTSLIEFKKEILKNLTKERDL
jgi:tetratricopeptide (TPR) repeat protein|tara:strand:+ start:50 stop:1747 length:1698 start_codon:yes stop_codon:yes gene_type:complete